MVHPSAVPAFIMNTRTIFGNVGANVTGPVHDGLD